PAFKGKRRELTAEDYIYAIMRLVDPATRSPNAFYVEGKIAGLDEAVAASKSNAKFDYGAKIAGLEAIDRHTLRIRLKSSDYTFSNIMALPSLVAVAHEVVEAYPGNVQAHPVGTGPYVLKSWVPASSPWRCAATGSRPILRRRGSICRAFSTRRSPTRRSICAIRSSEG